MHRAAVVASLASLGSAAPAIAQGPNAPLPLLTEISAIRSLSQDEGARGYPVRIRGLVTHFDEVVANELLVYDGEFGQYIVPPHADGIQIWHDIRTGDVLEIQGHTIRGGFAPNILPESVRKV